MLNESTKVTDIHALHRLYDCVNGPYKAGPKWVTYNRDQVEAMLSVLKQVLTNNGYEFRNVTTK